MTLIIALIGIGLSVNGDAALKVEVNNHESFSVVTVNGDKIDDVTTINLIK